MAKVYPVRENAHIQMYLLLSLLNLTDVNVITYVCLFVFSYLKKYHCSQGSNKMKTLPHGFSWKCLRTIGADSSGDTANDQVLTEFIPFSGPYVGFKSVIDQT